MPVNGSAFEVFQSFDGTPRLPNWRPVPIKVVTDDERGRALLQSDVPWLGKHVPVFRETALAALAPSLAECGEMLPLECASADLVAFNTTTILEALDLERSESVNFPSTGRIMKVKSYVFRPERLGGVHAFKVPELTRGSVFVTDDVVSAAQEAGLRGVGFRQLWEGAATGS